MWMCQLVLSLPASRAMAAMRSACPADGAQSCRAGESSARYLTHPGGVMPASHEVAQVAGRTLQPGLCACMTSKQGLLPAGSMCMQGCSFSVQAQHLVPTAAHPCFVPPGSPSPGAQWQRSCGQPSSASSTLCIPCAQGWCGSSWWSGTLHVAPHSFHTTRCVSAGGQVSRDTACGLQGSRSS